MKKIYIVLFEVHDTLLKETNMMVYHCMAETAKKAKETAKAAWPKLFSSPAVAPHMYNLHAAASRLHDPDLLALKTWKGIPFYGKKCFDFFCTEVIMNR